MHCKRLTCRRWTRDEMRRTEVVKQMRYQLNHMFPNFTYLLMMYCSFSAGWQFPVISFAEAVQSAAAAGALLKSISS